MPTVGMQPPVAAARGRRALLADLLDPLLHLLDPLADDPPVGLELRLARSARADPAAGPRQVGPQPRQAGQLVLELGELDLEAALVRLSVEGEDVEDQPAAVDDLDLEQLLERSLLAGRQLVVGHEDVEPGLALRRDELAPPCPCRRTSSGRHGGGSAIRRRRPRLRRSWRGWPARRAIPRPSSRRPRRCRPPTRNAFSTGTLRSIMVRGIAGKDSPSAPGEAAMTYRPTSRSTIARAARS